MNLLISLSSEACECSKGFNWSLLQFSTWRLTQRFSSCDLSHTWHSVFVGRTHILLLLLITALQLLVQSFGLLNHFLPTSPILEKGLPIWHFWSFFFFNIILPAYLWSSCWPLWNGFLGVYCFDHSCFLHSFDMTIPSWPLRSGEVYYVMFYWFIQFLISFYSLGSIFIGWAEYFPQNFPFKNH